MLDLFKYINIPIIVSIVRPIADYFYSGYSMLKNILYQWENSRWAWVGQIPGTYEQSVMHAFATEGHS